MEPTRLGEVVLEEHLVFRVCYVHKEGEQTVPKIEKSIFLHECIHVIVANRRWMNVRATLLWCCAVPRGGLVCPRGDSQRGLDPALIVSDFKGCPLRQEVEGVEGLCDCCRRGTAPLPQHES